MRCTRPFRGRLRIKAGYSKFGKLVDLKLRWEKTPRVFYSGTWVVLPSFLTRAALGMYKDALGGLLKGL